VRDRQGGTLGASDCPIFPASVHFDHGYQSAMQSPLTASHYVIAGALPG
jgi:hypothetical protein